MKSTLEKISNLFLPLTVLSMTLAGATINIQSVFAHDAYTQCVANLIELGVSPDVAAQQCRLSDHNKDNENLNQETPEGPVAMDDSTFSQFLSQVKQNWPKELEFIQMTASTSYFTSDQTRQVVEKLTFKKDQEKAALALYPKVVDPQNWFVVQNAFTFSSSWDRVNDLKDKR